MMQFRRWTRRLGVAALATTAVTLAGAGQAHALASPTDAAAAIASNTFDSAAAAANVASMNLSNPDITCLSPVVGAVSVTPAADVVVAEVKANEATAGAGHCLSYQHQNYAMSLAVQLEYFDAAEATWSPICVVNGNELVRRGVGVAFTVPAVCTYKAGEAPDGKPHRAHAILTNSLVSGTYESYSPVWVAGAGPVPQQDVAVPEVSSPDRIDLYAELPAQPEQPAQPAQPGLPELAELAELAGDVAVNV